MRRQGIQRQATISDLRGPSTLRSGLVSNPTNGRWDHHTQSIDGLEPCDVIGEGKYGIVHTMREKSTGQLRVVKTVERPAGWDNAQLKLEAEILQNLDHPHILRIFSWYEDGDAVNIIMEHCEGGELMKVAKEAICQEQKMPEMWASCCIRQTFEALVYIHSKGIVHKDLKSANLLLLTSTVSQGRVFGNPPHVIVCDLGLAEVCSRNGIFGIGGGGRAKRVAGTPVTMAPEVWKGSFGPKSDVWSMGCVMFELLTGEVPFKPARNEEALWAEEHRRGPKWDLYDNNISMDALRLNELILTVKEALRPSAFEVLQHAWIKKSPRQKLSQEELDSLVVAVRQWNARNPMQRALSLKMAAGCTCLKKFAALFSEFDADNSGILDQGELIPALESLGLDNELAREVARSLDVNSDGSCEYLEFAAACLSSLEEEFDELLRQEFNLLDIERKTWLTDTQMNTLIDELRPLADKHGLEMQDIDENGDGVISFREFVEYFGRPGADLDSLGSETPTKKPRIEGAILNSSSFVKQLPMKEHIRIVREDVVESFIQSMNASMEASRKGSSEEKNNSGMNSSGMRPVKEEADGVRTDSKDRVVDRILWRMQQHQRNSGRGDPKKEDEVPDADAPGPVCSPASPKTSAASACSSGRRNQKNSGEATMMVPPIAKERHGGEAIGNLSGSQVFNRSPLRDANGSAEASHSSTVRSLSLPDSECSVSIDIMGSHQSQHSVAPDSCAGCWLSKVSMPWLDIQGIGKALGLGCGRSPTSDQNVITAAKPRPHIRTI